MGDPEIHYPCRWTYRVVATDAARVKTDVTGVVEGRSHELRPSQRSAKGTYVSFHLELEVRDQADRDAIFAALQEAPSVTFVL